MGLATYTVKSGDNLTKICNGRCGADIPAQIAGNTVQAKIATLVSLNGIANPNLIYVGQILKLSEAAGGGDTSSSSSTSAVEITGFGLQSNSETGRDMYVQWSSKYHGDKLKHYRVRWEWFVNGHLEHDERTINKLYDNYDGVHEDSPWVQVFILPVPDEGATWSVPDKDEVGKQYWFSENPPLTPPEPSVEIDNDTLLLTASYDIKDVSALFADSVRFNIVQDNSTSIHLSEPIGINRESNKLAYQYYVEPGHTYTVRAYTVSTNGKASGWSDFSEEVGTRPVAPSAITTYRRNKRTDGSISAYLEWTAVSNAKSYKIEYVTIESDFENAPGNIQEESTDKARTSLEITNIEAGSDYYFRVRAVNADGESEPTAVVKIPIGEAPAAPTTWSSSESAFVGDVMELNWIHNPKDNSKQTFAQLRLNINDSGWVELEVIKNTTDPDTTGERVDETKYTYGTAVSYKGNLYFKMDTNHVDLKNAKIVWSVRTAGVTDEFSDTGWSVDRTIYIYEKPRLDLSVTKDVDGNGSLITTLTTFPFYVRGKLSLSDYTLQRPVGYYLQILSNNYYVTVDDVGKTKTINPGDTVYSKYFDTSETLVVEMSANNLDLESGIQYTIYCYADMSTGLSVGSQHDFNVSWVDVEYAISANISVSADSYTALITPYCREKIPTIVGEGDDAYTIYEDGPLVDNVTLSVYRREYDGSYKEIASGIPNNYTSVTDPHPALDFARYRFTAKDKINGALSFWDMAGYPVNGSAVIIQWAEEWSTFDVGNSTAVEGPSWSGSLLKLPYNIKITDSRKREKTLVAYAGREHPVSYYGTQLDESSQWSMEIPADDKDTIYALRRLSLWAGDVYVREPSGMGFWATVEVSFNKSYSDVKIPITLNVTRVEGGV